MKCLARIKRSASCLDPEVKFTHISISFHENLPHALEGVSICLKDLIVFPDQTKAFYSKVSAYLLDYTD